MTDAPIHLPPQDLAAEEAILGAMLQSKIAVETALERVGLVADHFYRPAHQIIFRAITAVAERDAVDELTVTNYLKNRRQLGAAGGPKVVWVLSERTPAIANAKAYAEAVRDAAILRNIVNVGVAISKLGYERPDDPRLLLNEAGRLVDEMTSRTASRRAEAGITTLADEFDEFYSELSDRRERGGKIRGISTGLDALDERWGGLQGGRLYIVAGRPGMGKSALGSGLAEAVAFGSGEHVYIVSAEMPTQEQAGRTIARVGSVNLHRLTNGLPTDEDFQATFDTMQALRGCAHLMHMDEATALTGHQVWTRGKKLNRKLKRETGKGIGLVVVDYIQKLEAPRGIRADNENAAITVNVGALKSMALDLKVPVVALAQLNRSVEARPDKQPNMSDLRGSGAMEQDADGIALLYRPEYYLKTETPPEWVGVAQIESAKMRGGRPGMDRLRWEGEFTRYSNYAPPAFVAGISPARSVA